MKALLDKAELKARNKAYKVTLEYCEETCDVIDKLYVDRFVSISRKLELSDKERSLLIDELELLKAEVKDAGTRKLRKAFTTYVLENTKE